MSTRQQALDVPISGPVVKIHGLSESKQVELARALRGADGEAVLDHAWRTPGLRELARIMQRFDGYGALGAALV